ncbi:protein obstructor-E-like [Liolophura sinensis]|uniref:protein obstructor-E-like n=1 Tax=Liolophura sinensis TaxID=3198878 RepID=UPI003158D5DD
MKTKVKLQMNMSVVKLCFTVLVVASVVTMPGTGKPAYQWVEGKWELMLDPGPRLDPLCEKNPNGTVADPDNCSYYYMCFKGKRRARFACPWSLAFNPETEKCDYPGALGEGYDCRGVTPHPYCRSFGANVIVGHPGRCDVYFTCHLGHLFSRVQCGPGLLFNDYTLFCDSASQVDCGTRPRPEQLELP